MVHVICHDNSAEEEDDDDDDEPTSVSPSESTYWSISVIYTSIMPVALAIDLLLYAHVVQRYPILKLFDLLP